MTRRAGGRLVIEDEVVDMTITNSHICYEGPGISEIDKRSQRLGTDTCAKHSVLRNTTTNPQE